MLVPWLVVLIHLLLRRHASTAVPHLPLWQVDRATRSPKPNIAKLPLRWLIWMIATFVAILAASQVQVGSNRDHLRIVYQGDDSRLKAYVVRFTSLITRFNSSQNVIWILPPTQQPVIAEFLQKNPTQHWIVATDESIKSQSENSSMIWIDSGENRSDATHLHSAPAQPVDVLIAAVSDRPRQMMVTVRANDADHDGVIEVESATARGHATFALQQKQTLNVFVDLPQISPEMIIRVSDASGVPLCQPRIWRLDWSAAKVVAADDVDRPYRQFAEAYAQIHPPRATSSEVLLSSRLPVDHAGVLLASSSEPSGPAAIVKQEHPIFAHTDLSPLKVLPLSIAPPPSKEWHVVATAGDRPIIAVRDAPIRQVWLGFRSDAFEQHEAFVILLADIVDWIGQGSEIRGHLDTDRSTGQIAGDDAILRAITTASSKRASLTTPLCILAAGLGLLSLLIRR